jgi:heptosyltransferase II
MGRMGKNLIIMPNWIGDIALALSVIIQKAETGHVDITLLAPQGLVGLCSILCNLPVIPYKRKSHKEFIETISSLNLEQFEKAFILPVSFSSAWCAFRARIPRRRGISKECRGILLTERLSEGLRNVNNHLTHEYAAVLETPFISPEAWQGRALAAIGEKSPYKDTVVFCPGSKYGPAKRWPWFGELARYYSQDNIVLLGDSDEAETGNTIESVDSHRIKNLIGKTTLTEVVSIIAKARLVVSNDSGLMHLAGFLGTTVVGIFGSTSPTWTRPLGSKARMAVAKIECSPCFSRTCRYGHYNCLKNISTDQVVNLADQLLSGQAPQ